MFLLHVQCVCYAKPSAIACHLLQAVFSDSDQVVLNVGGCRFTTTVSTLRSAPSPSLFAAMFSGRHAVVRGADGAVFIDRCGDTCDYTAGSMVELLQLLAL
jgi:hypothetical protein